MAERFDIELAAFEGGVPMPRPVPTRQGCPFAELGATRVRCHEWVEGSAKFNEDTTVGDAARMGRLVAGLHGLSLPWSPRFDSQHDPHVEPTWASLAEAGTRRGARWARRLSENLAEVERLAEAAQRLREQHGRQPRVGSHRDLNAHNVLFGESGLFLIDWDAAGPVFLPWERANYATLWAARPGGRYDADAVLAFLRGYRAAGGEISSNDPDTLDNLLEDVENWTKKNIRWAVSAPTDDQDLHADLLVAALLATPATIDERRRLLDHAVNVVL